MGVAKVYGLNYKDAAADARKWLRDLGDPYAEIGADTDGRVGIDWGVYGGARDLHRGRRGPHPAQARGTDDPRRALGRDSADHQDVAQMTAVLLVILAWLGAPLPSAAVEPGEMLADPVLEARAATSAGTCAAWFAGTSRSTIPTPAWPGICASWCASVWSPATATQP